MLGFGAMLLVYMVFVRPKVNKQRRDPLVDQPFRASVAQQKHAEREMSNLLVELSEMARQITAQLDTRATKLELLIKQADERLEQLEARSSQQAPPSPWQLPPDGKPTTPTDVVDARHAEIYALRDDGKSVDEIAHHLGRPNGEIELILALRPRR